MRIDGSTKLFLLLGNPVSHSLSPLLHNAAFKALGLNCVYLAATVEQEALPHAVAGLRALKVGGANITAPYKEAVMAHLDDLAPQAQLIRSVNTVVNREGRLYGDSTDGPGFILALREAGPPDLLDEPVMIVGAGGAARAVAFSLAKEGAAVFVANRTAARAVELVELLRRNASLKAGAAVEWHPQELRRCWEACRTMIYCLPGDSAAVAEVLGFSSCRGRYFFDLRYHPPRSALMRRFQEQGGTAYNGKGMLLWQAALSFNQFSGREAPLEEMRRALGCSDLPGVKLG